MAARLLKDPATAGSRIFVGHLQTEEMNRNELEEHFSKYGTIVGSLLNRGFGFVQFEDEQAAQNAIKSENGAMFKGRRIDVKPAKKETGGMGGTGGGMGGGGGNGGGFGGNGGGFGGNDSFGGNNNFGSGNSNFNNSNSSFNDNQFNRGGAGSGGGGGNNSFSDQDDSFSGKNNNDMFNSNKGNGPPFGNRGGQRNQNQNQGGPNQSGANRNRQRGGKNRKNRDGPMGDRMGGGGGGVGGGVGGGGGGGMNDRMDDLPPFGDRMGGGMGGGMGGMGGMGDRIGDRMGGGIGDRIGGGIGDRMGGGIGDSLSGGTLGSSLGSSFRSGIGGSLGSNLGGGLGSSLGSGLGSSLGSGLGGGLNNSNMDRGLGLNSNIGGGMGSSFRDRSPLNRGGRMDDKPLANWELNKPGPGGPGGRGGFGGGFGDHKSRFDDFKGPVGPVGRDSGPGFGPAPATNDYPSIAAEKNDCEIIVVTKALTEYAEIIESRLKKLGLTVDLLFPNEDVPLTRVLGNIASRGCLYAIVIAPTNKEHHSLTLNILHGLPQEHRNMPVDDAINLIMRDFNNYKSGGRSVPTNVPSAQERHPDAIQVLLNMLADNLQLTVLQYERVIKYLEMRREEQVQFELGEDAKNLGPTSLVSDPKQAELQSRILNILNSNKSSASTTSTTTITTATPSPVPPPAAVTTNVSSNSSAATSSAVTQSPLLNDPTVQKALDSLLQGNLLKNIGDQPTPATSAAPLFAAFPNINRL